jgi:hypothetical protein
MITLVDMPGDDLRLFQAFTKIGQVELGHGSTHRDSAELIDLACSRGDTADRRHVIVL